MRWDELPRSDNIEDRRGDDGGAAQGERPGAAIVPDAFTHGTSEQRKRGFTNGLKAGTIEACDTFNAAQL